MLTNREIGALNWAVQEAATWRGSMVGNPDPAPLQQFDAKVKEARRALRKLREARKGGKP